MIDRIPQVFVSYSWTTKEYQQLIIDLATRMRHDGVDIKLDVWDLKNGQDKYAYMEQCVTNPDIDKVLILSDKMYAEKADQRKGGVGDETTIISSEVYGHAEQQKFIPVVMERNDDGKEFLPAYLKSRMYVDLSETANYEEEYEKLLRTIFDEPIYRKPEIGERPRWLTEEKSDGLFPLKSAVKKIDSASLERLKRTSAREFVDLYIESMKQFYMKNIDKVTYLENFKAMKEYRNIFLDHLKSFSMTKHFGETIADEFEHLHNSLYNVYTFEPNTMSCGERDFDIFRLHVWELFLCTVAFMLHFELYSDIHELLSHTYFLRESSLGSERKPCSYEMLRFYSKMMEEVIKPTMDGDLSRKYTLVGHFICTEREYMPIYSAKAMANADLFLYQIYNGLDLDGLTEYGAWFPTLYIYADEYDSIWKRLKSKKFCEKIMLAFGVTTIDSLKGCIEKCTYDGNYRYFEAWHGAASAILTWIKAEDVATLP